MFYCLDENRNLVEAYDKEGVLAVLEQAIANGSLEHLVADASFISKIKCCVSGETHKVAFVTWAKINELKALNKIEENVAYFILDDDTIENIDAALETLNNSLTALGNRVTSAETRIAATETKLEREVKTVTLNGLDGSNVVLEGGFTYVFHNSMEVYFLHVRKNTTNEMYGSTTDFSSLCTINGGEASYLEYIRYREDKGKEPKLQLYHTTYSEKGLTENHNLLELKYYKLLNSEVNI